MENNKTMISHIKVFSIALTMSAMISAGCSALGTVRVIVPECNEGQWSQIKEEQRLYRCEYACGGSVVRVREIRLRSWGLVGLPLIPFIPVSNKEPKKLLFDIHIMSKEGKLPDQPPNIKLKESAVAEEYSPIKVVHVEKNITVIKEEEMYHTDFVIYDDGRTAGKTYLFKFDKDRKALDTFELIFPADYMECSIPNIRYKAKKKFIYRPFVIPSE
jgi:hypothetical protein